MPWIFTDTLVLDEATAVFLQIVPIYTDLCHSTLYSLRQSFIKDTTKKNGSCLNLLTQLTFIIEWSVLIKALWRFRFQVSSQRPATLIYVFRCFFQSFRANVWVFPSLHHARFLKHNKLYNSVLSEHHHLRALKFSHRSN